ncbi:14586_t:CDS:2, partial [Acaulospora colombiana]
GNNEFLMMVHGLGEDSLTRIMYPVNHMACIVSFLVCPEVVVVIHERESTMAGEYETMGREMILDSDILSDRMKTRTKEDERNEESDASVREGDQKNYGDNGRDIRDDGNPSTRILIIYSIRLREKRRSGDKKNSVTYRELVQHVHAERDENNLMTTRWDIEKSRLQYAESKVLDDQRVLHADPADKVAENRIEHENPRFRILEGFHESMNTISEG